jgi:hypothetical protein
MLESSKPDNGAGMAGAGLFLMMPGIRKSSGETDCDALMPPQPPVATASATNIANVVKLPFNLTRSL